MKSFLVFDIETIKDNDMIQKVASDKIKERIEEGGFPPAQFHRVVAVSVMSIYEDEKIKFSSWCYPDEKKVLELFWKGFLNFNKINQNSHPSFISFNGKNFDIPVLILRSLQFPDMLEKLNEVFNFLTDDSDQWEKERPNYFNRYTKYHIDLIELFGTFRTLSLKTVCYLCGIPVKEEAEGNQVEQLFEDGQFEKIAKYCAEDVKATALLYAYLNKYIFKKEFVKYEDILDLEANIKI